MAATLARGENRLMMHIGELARSTKETVETIRYWENQDLLEAKRNDGTQTCSELCHAVTALACGQDGR